MITKSVFKRRFPFTAGSGFMRLCWGLFRPRAAQEHPRAAQERPKRAKIGPKQAKSENTTKIQVNEGRASEAGGRKESEKITRAVQAKQAAEKRANR